MVRILKKDVRYNKGGMPAFQSAQIRGKIVAYNNT
jgi:hypothetical protein